MLGPVVATVLYAGPVLALVLVWVLAVVLPLTLFDDASAQ